MFVFYLYSSQHNRESVDTTGPLVHFHVPIRRAEDNDFGVILLLSSISDMDRRKYIGEKLDSERARSYGSAKPRALKAAHQTGESGPY